MRWLGFVLLVACNPARPTYRGGRVVECPQVLSGVTYLNHDCVAGWCEVRVEQDDCAIELRVTSCDLPSLNGTVDADGVISWESANPIGRCVEETPRGGAEYALSCPDGGTCSIELFEAGVAPAVELEEIVLTDGPPYVTDQAGVLDGREPRTGYFSSAALSGQDLMVATFAGEIGDHRCRGVTSELVIVRGRDVVDVVPANGCWMEIGQDAHGVFGVLRGDVLSLARIDAAGQITASTTITEDLDNSVHALEADADNDRIIVALSDTELVAYGALTLAEEARAPPIPEAEYRDLQIVGDAIVAAEKADGQLILYDRDTLVLQGMHDLVDKRRASDDAGAMFLHAGSGRLLVSATGDEPVLFVLEDLGGDAKIGSAVPLVRVAASWAMAPWRTDDRLVLVGKTGAAPDYPAHLTWASVADRRYEPSSVEVGYGAVSQLLVGPDGIIWATLPWSGRLVRVTVP